MSEQDHKTIKRILKVNHAGEYGAVAIYRAQLFVSKWRYPELVDFLSQTLGHEQVHRDRFLAAMPVRNARPCYVMGLWSLGGAALGVITALLGKNLVMVCTAAVERTVHQHLQDQIRFLDGRDDELKSIIQSIEVEELEHLAYAETNMMQGPLNKIVDFTITLATEIVIFLSTQGDVTRMSREIRQNSVG